MIKWRDCCPMTVVVLCAVGIQLATSDVWALGNVTDADRAALRAGSKVQKGLTETNPAPSPASAMVEKPITLLEARAIIEARGKEWDENAGIVSIQSVQLPSDTSLSGSDGRRRAWVGTLAKPGAQLSVNIVDGTAVHESERPNGYAGYPNPCLLTVDSPEALGLARSAMPDFGSDNGKGQGFRFAFVNDPEPEITVAGRSDGAPTTITINAQTGRIQATKRLAWDSASGGIAYSIDGGQTWQASTLRGPVSHAWPDPLESGSAYATGFGEGRTILYKTQDGGRSWTRKASLPIDAGDHPFSLRAVTNGSGNVFILVGTATGLWVSRSGTKWTRVPGLPAGPVQWLATIQSDTAYRLIASISAGPNRGLYASTNLSAWTQEAVGTYRPSESYRKEEVLATDQSYQEPPLLLDAAGKRRLKLAGSVLEATGDFSGSGPLIWRGAAGVTVSTKLASTLAIDASVLAVWRDFLATRSILVGTLRNGIYRSTDGGETWKNTLLQPPSLVPGTGEIYDLVFLSSSNALAVIGGRQLWQTF